MFAAYCATLMRAQRILCLLACSLAVACGGASGPVDSGLPADKKVSELSDSEAEQLCEARADHQAGLISESEAKRAGCTIGGLFTGTVEGCEEFVKACLDAPSETDPGQPGTCTLGFNATCEATVADVEACLTDLNVASADALKSISCSDLENMSTGEPSSPASCSSISSTCPGVG